MFSVVSRRSASKVLSNRGLQTTAARLDHSSDSYSKEVDGSPPIDQKTHRVDPDSDAVQRPLEPPSGQWSKAGVQHEAYRHVEGSKEPYAPEGGTKGNHGSRKTWAEEKGPETSGKEDGPDAKSSGGRL